MTATAPVKALVYGSVGLNNIDGSAVWAQSAVESLAGAGCAVTLLLRTRVRRTTLIEPLERLPNVRVVKPFEERLVDDRPDGSLSMPEAVALMGRLDEAEHFDVILIRGFQLASEIVDQQAFSGRLWTYLTDIPQSVAEMDADALDRLGAIVEASIYLLCQTEEFRSYLEGSVPAAAGRCVLFPPVIPRQDSPASPRRIEPGEPLRLVYSGKFATRWNTLEMTALPAQLAARGVRAELHAVGDKISSDPADPEFHVRMRTALESTPGVIWHGAQSRQAAMAICAAAHVGLSWRDPELDSSLELSTKLLEYGSVGLAVALNRTPMHEDLLGVDYPVFVRDATELVDVLCRLADAPEIQAAAAGTCLAAAADYQLDHAIARLRILLERAAGRSAGGITVSPASIDPFELDRRKLEGARFHLGIVATSPADQQLELALDVLARLRRRDPRYALFVMGPLPRDEANALGRIQAEPDLRDAVTFDGPGPYLPNWLRRIGWILATGDHDISDTAVLAGMASRAVPVIRGGPGVEPGFGADWAQPDSAAMAASILERNASGRWAELGTLARTRAEQRLSAGRTGPT